MALRCNFEPFDEFMKFYSKIVPNIYTPGIYNKDRYYLRVRKYPAQSETRGEFVTRDWLNVRRFVAIS